MHIHSSLRPKQSKYLKSITKDLLHILTAVQVSPTSQTSYQNTTLQLVYHSDHVAAVSSVRLMAGEFLDSEAALDSRSMSEACEAHFPQDL